MPDNMPPVEERDYRGDPRRPSWKRTIALVIAGFLVSTVLHLLFPGMGLWLRLGVLALIVLGGSALVEYLAARRRQGHPPTGRR